MLRLNTINKTTKANKRANGEVRRRFHFTCISPYTNGAATTDLNLNSLETVCLGFAELSDLYRYFKFNKLKVTTWVGGVVSSSDEEGFYALYHQPNAATITVPDLNTLEGKFAMGHIWTYSSVGVPGKNAVLELHRDDLTTISPWFVTLDDAAGGADMDGPGVIKFIQASGMSNSGDIIYEVDMDVTFKTMLDPSTISAAAERRAMSNIEKRELAEKAAKLENKGYLQAPEVQRNRMQRS